MKISNLAALGAGVVGVSALSGFGAQLGRDAHRNFGNIALLAVAIVIGLGSFVLPYKAMAHLFGFHPLNGRDYFSKVILRSAFMLLSGLAVLYVTIFLVWVLLSHRDPVDFESAQIQARMIRLTIVLATPSIIIGAIVGMARRRKQKRTYAIYQYNQKFLDQHGFQEYKGSKYSHVDGFGNKLNLISQGKDFLEFEAANGEDAFLMIGPEGRFSEYVRPAA